MGALRSALAAKFADGAIIVVKALDVKEPKTIISVAPSRSATSTVVGKNVKIAEISNTTRTPIRSAHHASATPSGAPGCR
jgi:ribosomal protein L4